MVDEIPDELILFVESFGCLRVPGEDRLWVEQLERLLTLIVETYPKKQQGYLLYFELSKSHDLVRVRVGGVQRLADGEYNFANEIVLEESGWVQVQNYPERIAALGRALAVVVRLLPEDEIARRCGLGSS